MSYVRLKHALAEVALAAIAHPDHAPTAALLLAYARRSRRHPAVALTALGRDAGTAPADAARTLLGTGLFDESPGADRISLSAPFEPFVSYLRRQAARAVSAQRLLVSSRRAGLPDEIRRAAALFNAGLFFECHEYLEDIWRTAPEAERAFYHGLVQAAAGCYHMEKGNVHGTRTLLQKAMAKLEPYSPVHREVDVASLLAGLRGVVRRLDRPSADPAPGRRARPMLPLVDGPPRARRKRVRASVAPRPSGPSRAGGGRPSR
jgi:hypothetical protein